MLLGRFLKFMMCFISLKAWILEKLWGLRVKNAKRGLHWPFSALITMLLKGRAFFPPRNGSAIFGVKI